LGQPQEPASFTLSVGKWIHAAGNGPIVCGDSHTSTHGWLLVPFAFGIGTSEVENGCWLSTVRPAKHDPKPCALLSKGKFELKAVLRAKDHGPIILISRLTHRWAQQAILWKYAGEGR